MSACLPLRPLRLLSAIVVCVMASSVQLRAEQPDPALTLPDINYPVLRDLLDKALTQSPQMLARNSALSRGEAERISANARVLPSLNATGRYTYEKVSASGRVGTDGLGLYYSLGLSQPVFTWGERSSEREIGKLAELISQKAYAEAYRDLAANVRSQFLRLIIMKRSLAVRAIEIASRERTLLENTTRMKSGVGSHSEVVAAQNDVDDSRFTLERETFEYAQARLSLSRLCGIPELADEQIPTDMALPVFSENQALRLVTYFEQSDSVKNLPSVLSGKFSLRQSELRYKVASVRLLPKVEFNAGTSLDNQTYLNNSSLSQDATRRYSAGISVNWTIFDGLNARAAKRSALADKRDADQRLQTLLQGLDDQKRALVTRFDLAVRGMLLAEGRNRRQHEALSETRDGVKQGRVSSTVLEQFERYALGTEVQAMVARAEVYARWNDLLSTLWMDPILNQLPAHYLSHGK